MTLAQTENTALLAERERAVARGVVAAHPIFAARAEGNRLWDADGNEYFDFAAGIGVLIVVHKLPRLVAAGQ